MYVNNYNGNHYFKVSVFSDKLIARGAMAVKYLFRVSFLRPARLAMLISRDRFSFSVLCFGGCFSLLFDRRVHADLCFSFLRLLVAKWFLQLPTGSIPYLKLRYN